LICQGQFFVVGLTLLVFWTRFHVFVLVAASKFGLNPRPIEQDLDLEFLIL